MEAAAISETRSATLAALFETSEKAPLVALDEFRALLDFLHRSLDEAGRVLGRLGGPHGQVSHLVGHDGKARARFAGSGGFDGGVERQEVGLEGDLVDGLDDLGGLVAGL